MTTTITAPPESPDVAFEARGEAYYQAALDEQAAELRALTVSTGRGFNPPAETGRPADVSDWIDRGESALEALAVNAEALALAAGRSQLTGELHYTAADVISWAARALELGCTLPRIGAREVEDVFRLVRVPNARLREEYERREKLGEEGLQVRLARAIGAMKGADEDAQPDTTYVLRVLGVEPCTTSQNALPSLRLFCPYDQAVALADELGLTYHEVGV